MVQIIQAPDAKFIGPKIDTLQDVWSYEIIISLRFGHFYWFKSFSLSHLNVLLIYLLTLLASKSVTISTIDIIPLIAMILLETKSMITILIVKVVWLIFRPVNEVHSCPVTPLKSPFCVDVRQAQPRLFTTM